jgi:hemerythrin-like domain-containing protein
MPVIIGKAIESDYTNPLGLLSDCHRRIEGFLNVLFTLVCQTAGRKLQAEERAALEAALRYFREAAPKHTGDEEESLFPRLRALPTAQPALSLLEALREEHEVATLAHHEVESLCLGWLAEDSMTEASQRRLGELLTGLKSLYESHIALEEGELFPLAQALLGDSELQDMAMEMASRRGLDWQAGAAFLNSHKPLGNRL